MMSKTRTFAGGNFKTCLHDGVFFSYLDKTLRIKRIGNSSFNS